MRVVERAGVSIKTNLQKSYPFKKNKCKEKCFVCLSDGKGNCRRSNVSYEIVCNRSSCEYMYIGETGRNAMMRGREHLKALEKRDIDSVLHQHIVKHHENDFSKPPCHQYTMHVTDSHTTALSRLVTEAVKIDQSENPLLNRKKGFRTNTVLKLNVET